MSGRRLRSGVALAMAMLAAAAIVVACRPGGIETTPGLPPLPDLGGMAPPVQQQIREQYARLSAGAPATRAQVEFSLGESVKVTSGPLSDFDGEIVDVNADAQKLKVLVDIFERQVPVELAFDQVKKID